MIGMVIVSPLLSWYNSIAHHCVMNIISDIIRPTQRMHRSQIIKKPGEIYSMPTLAVHSFQIFAGFSKFNF
jgi:hypothetical protein